METTRAAVCERYGPPEVVRVVERPRPVPAANEVLIRSRAACVSVGDTRMRAARVPRGMRFLFRLAKGWNGPRQGIFGFDTAGEIVAVGSGVKSYRVGDRVLGSRGMVFGCHAEHVAVREDGALAPIPDGIGDVDAAALVFGGTTCLAFFEAARLRKGERILINGASGAVGVLAVQLAKEAGAIVTAVCGPTSVDLVRGLGADRVIDYTKEDFRKGGETYDVVMDNHGNAPYSEVRHLLSPGGRFLLVIGDLSQMLGSLFSRAVVSPNDEKKALNAKNLRHLLDLAKAGRIRAVVEKTYRFEDIAEAHRHVDGGHKKGSVVVTFD